MSSVHRRARKGAWRRFFRRLFHVARSTGWMLLALGAALGPGMPPPPPPPRPTIEKPAGGGKKLEEL
jgi:hypothetical protein